MKKIIRLLPSAAVIMFIFMCGQIVPGIDSGIKSNLLRAKNNINKAEALEDLKLKDGLLEEAYNLIRQAELSLAKEKNRKEMGLDMEIRYGYALYYYVKGDYFQAKKNIEQIKTAKIYEPHSKILEVRLALNEKGSRYAKEAIDALNYLIKNHPDLPDAYLVLGDSHYHIMDLEKAKQNYRKVLFIGGDLQVQAADRLETLDEIEKVKLDPKQFQNIIFSKAVRRDQIADILGRVFKIERYVRFPKALKEFSDISVSLNSASILLLRGKGFFSYIDGDKFDPLKYVTRREMARLIEDFIVLTSGSEDYRTRYPKNVKSPIPDVDPNDAFYNAIRIAVKENIIDLSLSGMLQPDKPLEGLEALGIINRMMKRFAQ